MVQCSPENTDLLLESRAPPMKMQKKAVMSGHAYKMWCTDFILYKFLLTDFFHPHYGMCGCPTVEVC